MAPVPRPEGDTPTAPPGSSAQTAATGMVWASAAVIVSKLMSFLCQILLGYILAVESYAVFGIVATAAALVGGFQNSGVSRVLIQRHRHFAELLPDFSAFALYFGILGTATLVVIGFAFERIYHIENLAWVISITSLTVFIIPVNAIQMAALGIRYKFREINLVEIKRSFIYYVVLIGAALAGAAYFTMAIALVAGTLAHFFLLKSQTPDTRMNVKLSGQQFIKIAWELRLVILTAFLLSLAMRADFLALSGLISIEDLGYYTFGFMLVTSITIPLSAGINQVFLPVFSRLQANQEQLHREIPRYSACVVVLGAALTLVLVGLSAPLIHLIWAGKWDPAVVVIAAVATAMPFRFLSTIAAAGLESYGKWGTRIALLSLDTLLLFFGAILGASILGLPGAALCAALQRAISGVIGYLVLARTGKLGLARLAVFFLRLYTPFILSVALLFALDSARFGLDVASASLGASSLHTLLALGLFLLLTAALNYATFMSISGFVRTIAKRRAG